MAKPPPFVAAKSGPKGTGAVGKGPKGNPFVAGKKKDDKSKKPNPFAK